MFEVLFLLLPIAALSGWWLGRRSKSRRQEESTLDLPTSYLRGLNYLLNEQQDKAIDLFIQLLDVDNDTVETHLALGSLFRRRGEVDRAIRIHQNLIARPTLSKEQRMQALFELGQDYMRAGLLDRAETLLGELITNGPHTVAALQHLLDIYQQEKDWDKAIQIAQRLESRTGQSKRNLIAQYYCEKADNVYRHGEPSKALKLLKRALAEDVNCARASMMEGDLEKSAGNYKAAIRAYHRVEQQEPDYLPEIIKSLTECYRAIGKVDDMVTFLRQNLAKHNSISIMLALAELIKQEKGEVDAADFITEYLKQRPSVRGMDRLIEINLGNVKESVRDKLQVLKDVTTRLIQDKPIYTCTQCGFTGRTLYWQCPSCKQWNTVKPIQGVEGE